MPTRPPDGRRPWTASAAASAAASACLLLGGCTIAPTRTPVGVGLTVTRDFGASSLAERAVPTVRRGDTALSLLERNARVQASGGGALVRSVDGLAAGLEAGRPVDWIYYVNGIEASGRTAATLHDGDHVWWDRHDRGAASAVPAVVGAFPEPFLHGAGGKRLPVRIECIDPASAACDRVSRQLAGFGIPAGRGGLGLAEHDNALRVLVGTWPRLRVDAAARRLEIGPAASGVYARVAGGGRSFVLLDQTGAAVRTLGARSGLVAATRLGGAPPVWIVTGTDDAGVTAAAQAFEPGALHDRFALAIANDLGVALPVGRP